MYSLRLSLAALVLAAASAPALADTVPFSDTFDSGTGALNTAPPNWTTTVGTVDFLNNIASSYGLHCYSGSTGCVDLDGTSNSAGRIETNSVFHLDAGQTYTLSAYISGNQLAALYPDRGPDTVSFGVFTTSNPSNTYSLQVNNIPASQDFVNYTLQFIAGVTGDFKVFVQELGGNDNVGAIVDNVKLTAVPLPASALLLLSGLLGLIVVARRKSGRLAASR